MNKPRLIDWNELSQRGLLMRINREILHPLGLAVCRDPATGLSAGAVVSDDGPFIYPDDQVIKCPEWSEAELAEFMAELKASKGSGQLFGWLYLQDPVKGADD